MLLFIKDKTAREEGEKKRGEREKKRQREKSKSPCGSCDVLRIHPPSSRVVADVVGVCNWLWGWKCFLCHMMASFDWSGSCCQAEIIQYHYCPYVIAICYNIAYPLLESRGETRLL